MFDNLTDEELMLLTLEYIVSGVAVPQGVIERLGEDTVNSLREETNA